MRKNDKHDDRLERHQHTAYGVPQIAAMSDIAGLQKDVAYIFFHVRPNRFSLIILHRSYKKTETLQYPNKIYKSLQKMQQQQSGSEAQIYVFSFTIREMDISNIF
jgi:hypothetical protein